VDAGDGWVVVFLVALFVGVAAFIWWSIRSTQRSRTAHTAASRARHERRVVEYHQQIVLAAQPVASPITLAEGETAIYHGRVERVHDAGYSNSPQQNMTTTSGRAVSTLLGGMLLGPVGALAGAAMSRSSTTTYGPAVTRAITVDDRGELVITSARVVFIGAKQTLEIPRSSILRIEFASKPFEEADGVLRAEDSPAVGIIRFRRADEPPSEAFVSTDHVRLAASLIRAGVEVPMPELPRPPDYAAAVPL
jgi:hypothetical protein